MEETNVLIPGEVKIIQDSDYFKFGNDSVFLANFTTVKSGDKVVDFGSGSGVIPLLLAYKKNPAKIIGIEIQREIAELSRKSVAMNGFEKKIQIICGNFKNASRLIEPGSIDLVVSNPPYMPIDSGKISKGSKKAAARHEIHANLEDVVRETAALLKFGGRMALVHRSFRLAEIINVMKKYKLEPKRLRQIHSRVNEPSRTLLLEARKGGRSGLKVEPPLIVYQENSDKYIGEVSAMYGDENYE